MKRLLLLLAVAAPAVAEEAPETIVVTGRSLPAPAGAAAYGTSVIDRDRLTEEPSGRLENVLRDVAGFQQFRRSDSRAANPTSQGATLRALGGNASSRALVLLDGVPQLDPFAGWVAWPSLAPERLSSARVTRGGGAGAFGAGAVAGTIELFSADADELKPFASLAYGSRESVSAGAGGGARLGDGFATATARFDRGDGYFLVPEGQRGAVDVPAKYQSWSVALRGVTAVGDATELQASAQAFDDDRRRGQVGADSNSRGADASLRLIGRGALPFEALAYVQARRFASGFTSVVASRASATPSLDQYNTPATGLGGKIELRPAVGEGHQLQIGADIRTSDGRTRERFRFQTGRFTRLREAGGETLTAGLYIEDSWTLSDTVTLTGGTRLDRWEISNGFLDEFDSDTGAQTLSEPVADRSGWRPTARAGALFRPTGAIELRTAAYAGFRLPTLNELYRPFRVGADATAANPGLALEKLRGIEAGIDYRPLNTVGLSLTAYWNELEDAISNVSLGQGPGTFPQVGFVAAGGTFRQRQNVDAIRVRGFEATGNLAYGDWRLTGSYAFADARVRASGTAAALDGQRPAQTPKHQFSGTVGWTRGVLAAEATGRYAGRQAEDDLGLRRLPDAFTVDAGASVRLTPALAVEVRAENLFDEQVVAGISGTGLLDLGTPRTLWVGLRFGGR
ncbi:TonB-dependent receptor [Sphingoaurantiacus capsulatus]|uniref:TonB-dependent receptor n=1 Tax=Sphingoaurantiacus capsulatus TaxID=1771310 RepID=A0ABV7X8T8_9SPHN